MLTWRFRLGARRRSATWMGQEEGNTGAPHRVHREAAGGPALLPGRSLRGLPGRWERGLARTLQTGVGGFLSGRDHQRGDACEAVGVSWEAGQEEAEPREGCRARWEGWGGVSWRKAERGAAARPRQCAGLHARCAAAAAGTAR